MSFTSLFQLKLKKVETVARSANQDIVESYRFDVRVISVSFAPGQVLNSLRSRGSQFARVGFTDVTTPEFENNVIEYRENTDNYVFRKIPGLQRFNEITLSRGVVAEPQVQKLTSSGKDFYRWVTRVNSPNPGLSLTTELTQAPNNNRILRQSDNFRKDMIIILRDRNGNATRRWYIVNAWPTFYKGSTDLNATVQEKAIESLRIEYEVAFELPSTIDAATELVANIFDSPFADVADDLNIDLGF